MIHYSCDRCRRPISSTQGMRYVVRMEIESAIDIPAPESAEDEQDCLMQMDEVLERIQDESQMQDESIVYQRKQFDLCPECYRKFIKNPVGREKLAPFGFSHN